MNVYRITHDNQPHIVEAESFGLAVILWRQAMREPWGEDWMGTEEPESVELIHDEPVIRKALKEVPAPSGPLPCWAIVELLGHRRVCGYVTEVDVCGRGFLRVEIPSTPSRPAADQYQGVGSVYAITPTTQAYCEVHAWEAQLSVPNTEPEPEVAWVPPSLPEPQTLEAWAGSPEQPAPLKLCQVCSDPTHDKTVNCFSVDCNCSCSIDNIPF